VFSSVLAGVAAVDGIFPLRFPFAIVQFRRNLLAIQSFNLRVLGEFCGDARVLCKEI
jgi:hypothetical protein